MFNLVLISQYAHFDLEKRVIYESPGEDGKTLGKEQCLAYIYACLVTVFELRPILNIRTAFAISRTFVLRIQSGTNGLEGSSIWFKANI